MFVLAGLVGCLLLLAQLILDGCVLPVDLVLFNISHILDDLLSLLGAEMRLVVQFFDLHISRAFRRIPVHLLTQEVLILAHRADTLLVSFLSLRLPVLNLIDELRLLFFSQLLQSDELKLVAFQSLKRGLILHSHVRAVICNGDVAQSTIVHRKGSLTLQEDGHVRVVGSRDGLAVQGLLDRAQMMALLATVLG